jgi:hypothetical protein
LLSFHVETASAIINSSHKEKSSIKKKDTKTSEKKIINTLPTKKSVVKVTLHEKKQKPTFSNPSQPKSARPISKVTAQHKVKTASKPLELLQTHTKSQTYPTGTTIKTRSLLFTESNRFYLSDFVLSEFNAHPILKLTANELNLWDKVEPVKKQEPPVQTPQKPTNDWSIFIFGAILALGSIFFAWQHLNRPQPKAMSRLHRN